MTTPHQIKKMIVVTQKDLPVQCPPADQALWNVHPRVFIPIKPGEQKKCPYCSTLFTYPDTL